MAKISTIFSNVKPSQEKLKLMTSQQKLCTKWKLLQLFRSEIEYLMPQEPWSGVSNAIPDATWHIDSLTGEPTWAHWKRIFLNGPFKSLGRNILTSIISIFLLFCGTASFSSICKRQKLKRWAVTRTHASCYRSRKIKGLFLGLFVRFFKCLFVLAFANQAYQLGAVICPKFSTRHSCHISPMRL